jgi:3',5'-cyclic AMP phosphodiesterase CpdA
VRADIGRLFWNRFVRGIAFWLIVAIVGGGLYAMWASLPARVLAGIVAEGLRGDLTHVTTEAFAFSLAKALTCLGFGLLIAFGALHALAVSVSIGRARALIQNYKSKSEFAYNLDRLRRRMEAHPLLGHAWKKFQESLICGPMPVLTTQRPQSFFSYAMVREKCIGLKIMPSVPNYFVGAGLVLTFIGLVIALYKTAEGTEAAQLAATGAGAAAMQSALRDLLHAATFKFSTSIAGLSVSIALAFFFRLYTIRIEASLGDFCEALENKLNYLSPQSVSVEMRDSLAAQLTQLTEINSEAFSARLGQDMAAPINEALTSALSPLAQQIHTAADQFDTNSKAGLAELLRQFSDTLQGGAAVELRELTGSLQAVLKAMEGVRSDISRSGEDFAARLGEAAQNLSRLVVGAGDNLNKQSETSRQALEQMLSSVRTAFDQAHTQMNANLSSAAEGASFKLADAMDRVLAKLEGQVTALEQSFGGFRETASERLAEVGRHMSEAQEQSARAVADVSAHTAAAIEDGLAAAMKSIRKEVEEFAIALRTSSAALGVQAEAIDRASIQTRQTADAFGECAKAVGSALDPLARSNEKMAEITSTVGEAVKKASASLDDGQQATRALGLSIAAQAGRLTKLWENYERRFSRIDEDLQRAFEKLAQETTKQLQLLAEQTIRIDKGLAGAVDKLAGPVQGIGDGAQELSESVGELKKLFDQTRAAA